ncbi:MAG TPA: hypothetical protein VEE84_08700 [Burkholderiaceae bacterium]|nr:hypothetical protein [Burkholderiaceae bacterium]
MAAIFVPFTDPAMQERRFANMERSLKPGGTLVLQGDTAKQLRYRTRVPPVLWHLCANAMLRSAFSAMRIVKLRRYEAKSNEGGGRKGRRAFLGRVAQRR